jgi:hypothetical protein
VVLLPLAVARGPVVACAASVLGQKDVLGIVEFAVLGGHDVVDDARFEVEEDGAWDVVFVVGLKRKKQSNAKYELNRAIGLKMKRENEGLSDDRQVNIQKTKEVFFKS